MITEQERLKDPLWKKWGPYVSNRQWGTVREDYSSDGDPWKYTTHDMARSRTYRWGEEGIGGISDDNQLMCFSVALWNKKDPFLKEVLFGLNNYEGNHGEDVKEQFYYLDSTPTHSYMKMLYKYPRAAFPYDWLRSENAKRTRKDPEFELIDTGIFDKDEYFDVFIEYAKASAQDILVKITIHNRSHADAPLSVLPTCWFRNTWIWDNSSDRPLLSGDGPGAVKIKCKGIDQQYLYFESCKEVLFCENETNCKRVFDTESDHPSYKDGINDFIVHGQSSLNKGETGTKAAMHYDVMVTAQSSCTIRLRLCGQAEKPFKDFDSIFEKRIAEADEFYESLQKQVKSDDARMIQRQALAGLLWNKQFYYYNIEQWLTGDPALPPPPEDRKEGRNHKWKHLNNADIISMPDKWEYPWYAAWDLAFHCVSLALVDMDLAKQQLALLTKEWYMHPGGGLPAYEWELSGVNPPVHAWAAWEVYYMEKKQNGGNGDIEFLKGMFHKLLLNFTWWVNRVDTKGNNIFEGGFLGLDNIGVFDRNMQMPDGGYIEQADGTSWVAMFALNMLHISLELANSDKVYTDMANKFFEHFLYIAGAMNSMNEMGLWDDEDEFFYDQLHNGDNSVKRLKVRSGVGLIPLFAVEVLNKEILDGNPAFKERMEWFLKNRPDLAAQVSRWYEEGKDEKHLLSLLRGHRMKRLLSRMLDEDEFLSGHGVRALSKYYEKNPYYFKSETATLQVSYIPGESDSDMFGGNSNWRGPVWMPLNYLIILSLKRFHHYYSDDFKVEYPTRSGQFISLDEIANRLSKRLTGLFLKDEQGKRVVFGNVDKLQNDPYFRDHILFHEYFHGDDGHGLGASHQTGWTSLIANIIAVSDITASPVQA